jgi:hypothetical protein
MDAPPPANDAIRMTALWFTGAIALIGMCVFGWCAIKSTYIDVPMLLVLSNATFAAVGAFTVLLTGRTVAQLNQNSDVTNKPQTEVTQQT